MIPRRRIVLTGASGFIGSQLLPELKTRGIDVTAASRAGGPDDVAFDPAGGRISWPGTLPAVDCVIHLGDGLKELEKPMPADRADALSARLTDSSVRLAERAVAAHATLFVYVSSIKAIAGETRQRPLTELSTPRPTGAYGRGKLALEQALRRTLAGTSCHLIILRNPLTYGIGATGNLDRLLRLLDSPLPLPHAGKTVCRSLLAVANFVDGMLSIVDHAQAPAGTYHIHDGPPLSVGEIMAALREGLGRPRRLVSVPQALWQTASAVPQLRPTVDRLAGQLVLDDSLFRKTFGWQPRQATREGLIATATAYRLRR